MGCSYYFATQNTASGNRTYQVFTAAGALHSTPTATGIGGMNGVYFDWSVGRYAVHDGYGQRTGGTRYNPVSGSGDDTQVYGPVSSTHSVP